MTMLSKATRKLGWCEAIEEALRSYFGFKEEDRTNGVQRCIAGGVRRREVVKAARGVCKVRLNAGGLPVITLNGKDITSCIEKGQILPGRLTTLRRFLIDKEGRFFTIQPDGPGTLREAAAVEINVTEISGKWG